jgi:EKC/KEOPS complex subunit CGI121/TPRKB
MDVIRYEYLPTGLQDVHLCLFEDVRNAAVLRQRLTEASRMQGAAGDAERQAVNFAFLDASRARHSSLGSPR